MRKVEVYNNYKKEKLIHVGTFHQWGVDAVEVCEGSAPVWTVAIVELEDGSIITPAPTEIKFCYKNTY